MATTFTGEIKNWVRAVAEAVDEVCKEAAQDLAEEITRPGPSIASTKKAIAKGALGAKGRGKKRLAIQGPVLVSSGGGRLPIDTGFLRASFMASTTAMPTIEASNVPQDGKRYKLADADVAAVIAGWETSQPLYFGFTAAYAAAMEYGANGSQPYAFVRMGAMKWPQFVTARAAEVLAKYGLNR